MGGASLIDHVCGSLPEQHFHFSGRETPLPYPKPPVEVVTPVGGASALAAPIARRSANAPRLRWAMPNVAFRRTWQVETWTRRRLRHAAQSSVQWLSPSRTTCPIFHVFLSKPSICGGEWPLDTLDGGMCECRRSFLRKVEAVGLG